MAPGAAAPGIRRAGCYRRWPQAAMVTWDRKEKSGSRQAAIAAAAVAWPRPSAVICGRSCSKVSCHATAPGEPPGQIVARPSVLDIDATAGH